VRVAIAQGRPAFLDRAACLDRAVDWIARAAGAGARLVVLGETWIPGYPIWLDVCPGAALWEHPPAKEVFARLRQNSVVVGGPHTEPLAQAAAAHRIAVVVGVCERVDAGPGNGTLYNSLLTFGPDGRLLNHHRKLVPTFSERMVWGPGDAEGLRAAEIEGIDEIGGEAVRVGGLVCWEHWMPLARQALHDSGEHLHVAVWPTVKEGNHLASRHYAMEGRCFVLAAGQILAAGDLPPELEAPGFSADDLVLSGGSALYGPDGALVAGPVYDREELLVADLDLTRLDAERMTLDVSGHYARPDLLQLTVHRNRR
jgi:nitrilase